MAKALVPRSPTNILPIYARNIELQAFKKGWSANRLALEIGTSVPTLNRVRFCRSKYIDPELFQDLLRVFKCTPNDLLLPQPDIDYTLSASVD
jgi:DNA-binding Xre family transcriptional regulator